MANKIGRRSKALLWLLAAAIIIGVLVALEQIALLYAVATIGLVILLLIVAFADLENVGTDGSSGFASDNN
jgi:hypothetical protein